MKSGLFSELNKTLKEDEKEMPLLFIGHGSPMNGIEDNEFSATWSSMAGKIALPQAVIVISAHWNTRGTRITAMASPATIHDFGGFPRDLFNVQYPAPGMPDLAHEIMKQGIIEEDHDWGLDHGAWTILRHMYPQANIPVLQLSIDYSKPPEYHFQLASELRYLRKKGVLLIGSGNMVHNLGMLSWDMMQGGGYDWALSLNEKFKELILKGDHQSLINFEHLGAEARLGIPTPEHYIPLLYTLGLQGKDEEIEIFNDKAIGGSLTMTSLKMGK